MGGTFDPIHHGHLVAASEVGARFGLDEVVFVPTGVPWQKKGRKVASREDRYLMTVIATASNPMLARATTRSEETVLPKRAELYACSPRRVKNLRRARLLPGRHRRAGGWEKLLTVDDCAP